MRALRIAVVALAACTAPPSSGPTVETDGPVVPEASPGETDPAAGDTSADVDDVVDTPVPPPRTDLAPTPLVPCPADTLRTGLGPDDAVWDVREIGDGRAELLVQRADVADPFPDPYEPEPEVIRRAWLYGGTTDGTLEPSQARAELGPLPRVLATHDLDGDHLPELLVLRDDGGIDVSTGPLVDGGPTSTTLVLPGATPTSVAVADLTGDGRPDLIVGMAEGASPRAGDVRTPKTGVVRIWELCPAAP